MSGAKALMPTIHFGYVVPVETPVSSATLPVVPVENTVLPVAARYFESFWTYDHFYGFSDRRNPYLESWTTLVWLAARFPALHVGAVVQGVGYRNPALLAKMGATLQLLSGGRFILGIGAGWREEEYTAYGYPFPRASVRIHQLEEAVQIIRRMWTEDTPTFKGEHFQIENATCLPHPDPLPPIMIGGEGEKLMLPLVARQADWWNCGDWSDLNAVRRKRDIVLEHAAQAGRSVRLTMQIGGREWPKTDGESAAWADFLHTLVELGFDYFSIDGGAPESPEILERFHGQVMQPLLSSS
jgi:hypothetical protein